MITDVATLLKGIIDEETAKLDQYELKHGPTIGKMYEGLTSEILNRAIPKELNLKFVTGVIHNGLGQMTGEIDCMLVRGHGEQIPYTSSYKWHVKDVIAVIEVKKTLYQNDLVDSYHHLRHVIDNFSTYIDNPNTTETFDISSSLKAFSHITGIKAPNYINADILMDELAIIYHTLITEQLSPIRIVIGYHGYKSEKNFRDALINHLGDNINSKGFGVLSFPQLIISGEYSIIKLNGQPYMTPMTTEYWDFLASSRANPILLILELLWTKLASEHNMGDLWGEDLISENLALLLSGKFEKKDGLYGWGYVYQDLTHKTLSQASAVEEWEPTYLTLNQFIIFSNLCGGKREFIDDPDLIKFLEESGDNSDIFFKSLIETGYIALEGNELHLTTTQCQCVILPSGAYAVAENNTGQLSRWIAKNIN